MTTQAKTVIKDWGPIITLGLFLLGHTLAFESRLSRVEQKVDDLSDTVKAWMVKDDSRPAQYPH